MRREGKRRWRNARRSWLPDWRAGNLLWMGPTRSSAAQASSQSTCLEMRESLWRREHPSISLPPLIPPPPRCIVSLIMSYTHCPPPLSSPVAGVSEGSLSCPSPSLARSLPFSLNTFPTHTETVMRTHSLVVTNCPTHFCFAGNALYV